MPKDFIPRKYRPNKEVEAFWAKKTKEVKEKIEESFSLPDYAFQGMDLASVETSTMALYASNQAGKSELTLETLREMKRRMEAATSVIFDEFASLPMEEENHAMGRVSYGVNEVQHVDTKEIGFVPFISFTEERGTLTFNADKVFATEALAKAVIDTAYMLLSGPQKNAQYSEKGELHGKDSRPLQS